MDRIDPHSLCQQLPPGTALIAMGTPSEGPEGMIWLREEPDRIPRTPPLIEVRLGLFVLDQVGLIPVMLRTGPTTDAIWETWINWHAPGTAPLCSALMRQTRLLIHWTTHETVARTHQIPWRQGATLQTIAEQIQTLPPWSMAAFDVVRDQLYATCPQVEDLWQALAHAPEGAV